MEGRCAHSIEPVPADSRVVGQCWNNGSVDGKRAELELLHHSLIPPQQQVIHGEVPDERAPFGSHISDREAVVDGQDGDAVTRKLDGRVEHLIVIERAAQRDDYILPRDTRSEPPTELDLDHSGHLPPSGPGSPDGHSIRSHDRRSDAPHTPIHVAMAVRCDREGIRKRITLFDDDLMAYAAPSGVKVYPLGPYLF